MEERREKKRRFLKSVLEGLEVKVAASLVCAALECRRSRGQLAGAPVVVVLLGFCLVVFCQ